MAARPEYEVSMYRDKGQRLNIPARRSVRTAAFPLRLLQSLCFALFLFLEAAHRFLDGAHVIASLPGALQTLLLVRGKLRVQNFKLISRRNSFWAIMKVRGTDGGESGEW